MQSLSLLSPNSQPIRPRNYLAAALLGGLALTGCQPGGPGPGAGGPGPGGAMAPEVATMKVAEQRVVLTTELPGRTSPYRIAEIRPQVNGLILKRLFEEGSDVKAGQELYQIDPAPFQAALDNAQAALGRVEANLPSIQARAERYEKALAEKAVSRQDFDDASGALKQAQAEVAFYKAGVETARINLGYTKVVSPISGRIGKSSVTDGAIVTAYQPTPLATIQQLDPIYVDVPQSTTELLRLQKRLEAKQLTKDGAGDKKVSLVLGDNTKYPLEGTLQFRDVSVEPSTASVILRMVFPNPDGTLLPGMFVRAVVEEGINERAMLVTQQAVMRNPKGEPLAMVLGADGKVDQKAITLDRALGSDWLVTGGLAPGDRVITEGLQKVRPGMAVREAAAGTGQKPAAGAPGQAAPQSPAAK